jgi:chromosome segregation ATPase
MQSQNLANELKQEMAIAKLKQESAEGSALLDRWKTDLTQAEFQIEVLKSALSLSQSHQKETQQVLGETSAQQEELKTKLDEAIQQNEKIKLELDDLQKSSAELLDQKQTLLGSNGWLVNDLEQMRNMAKRNESANQLKHQAATKVLQDDLDDAKDALACAVEEVIRIRGRVTEVRLSATFSYYWIPCNT